MLVIDGSHGEGGGGVLRTAVSLSAMTGVPVEITNVRAKRRKPGLRPQHVTALQALAGICGASVAGVSVGSRAVRFDPHGVPAAGNYAFDVAKATRGGSAGAVSLIFQAMLLPLAFSSGDSQVRLLGGTHVAWSPPFQYLESVYLPALRNMGVNATLSLSRWGWYPVGGGVMVGGIRGQEALHGEVRPYRPLRADDRGELKRLRGISAVSNLPDHIVERQKRHAETVLHGEGLQPRIETVLAESPGRGTMLFLLAECEHSTAGFTAYGRRGVPAETVAEEACEQLLEWWRSGAALDRHLADQLIVPAALARGGSVLGTCRITEHLQTAIWVVEQFGLAVFEQRGELGKPGTIIVKPTGSGLVRASEGS